MAEWDEQREWRYLAATHSPMVEWLRERFGHMEVQGVEPVHRFEVETVARMAQPLPACQIPSPAMAARAVNPPPQPVTVASLGPR